MFSWAAVFDRNHKERLHEVIGHSAMAFRCGGLDRRSDGVTKAFARRGGRFERLTI
jgi:hypothetical protein